MIQHGKCYYRTDDENLVSEPCRCEKVILYVFVDGLNKTEEISVCRNWWANKLREIAMEARYGWADYKHVACAVSDVLNDIGIVHINHYMGKIESIIRVNRHYTNSKGDMYNADYTGLHITGFGLTRNVTYIGHLTPYIMIEYDAMDYVEHLLRDPLNRDEANDFLKVLTLFLETLEENNIRISKRKKQEYISFLRDWRNLPEEKDIKKIEFLIEIINSICKKQIEIIHRPR